MMNVQSLKSDPEVIERIFGHIDNGTTDLGDTTWREPVANYLSEQRLRLELELMRRSPVPLCPSAALPEPGSFVAREAAGTPLLAVRGNDGHVRVFRNACRHRGTALVAGSGCSKVFVCPYHGWAYDLDGALRHVPHGHGFPELDKHQRGLVPVDAIESRGLVVVRQKPAATDDAPDPFPELIPSDYRLFGSSEDEIPTNWKIFAEGFLEGYHIRATHARTFYPRQYDNLNVVERFGRNNRIAFPYRAIEKLRDVPPSQRSADGVLTYVYHLFPNVMIATFPRRIIMVVLEPVSVDRTRTFTYNLSNRSDGETDRSDLRRDADFVSAGAREDREMACAIQRGLAAGANEFLEFGRFESAIEHFHAEVHRAVERLGEAGGE